MYMKKIIAFLPILVGSFISCSKSSDGGGGTTPTPPTTPAETAIAFTINASNNSVSLTNGYAVTATLTSIMPSSKGITIETTLVDQSNSSNIAQSAAVTSTSAVNNLQFINLPQQHWCTATVKVSSVATPSNSSSQSFTVVYK
jgi:hypothetical protein